MSVQNEDCRLQSPSSLTGDWRLATGDDHSSPSITTRGRIASRVVNLTVREFPHDPEPYLEAWHGLVGPFAWLW